MSKVSTHELDMQIQLSLVAKIRQAAQRYKSEPAEEGSTALLSYIAALEGLAEHIEAKTRGARLAYETELRAERLKLPISETAKPRPGQRVIQFPASNGASPLTAA
jgi:hypothetical protein